MATSSRKVGVVVGRFQVAQLHEGHKRLIAFALGDNDITAIVLGKGEALPTERNPLPSPVRACVIRESFPTIAVLEIDDHPSDACWSENLDSLLTEAFPDSEIRLYASRDSFSPHYSGRLPIVVVPMVPKVSGTEKRAAETDPSEWDISFRKGMIAAQRLRPALSYQAVDIAVIRYPELEILLGQKETDDGKWRLIGGFTDPKDGSLEEAALRELTEEAGNISSHELTYVGSYRVDDWRYRRERDKIMTALFVTYYLAGAPHASDDLAKIAWFPLSIGMEYIVETHRPLIKRVIETVKSTN